jgi:mono/diheme cytochrome c family protein
MLAGDATFSRMSTAFLRAGVLLIAAALAACKAGTPASAPTPATTAAGSGAPPRAAAEVAAGRAAAGITPQLIARGDSVFHASSCTDCHGRNAKGSPHGPDLTSGHFVQTDGSYDEIVKLITTGVTEDKFVDPSFPEPMPARGGGKPPLSDEQIRALAAYVYSLSHR